MTETQRTVIAQARAIEAVVPLILDQAGVARVEAVVAHAVERGHFTPEEDMRVRDVFHDYLTARAVVHQVIHELKPLVKDNAGADVDLQRHAFVVGYAGACALVRAGRAIVNRLAAHPVARRKLDEPNPERGIPRRRFTAMYRSLTSPRNALQIQWARDYAKNHRDEIDALADDPMLGPCVGLLRDSESALDVTVGQYLFGRLRFYWHSLKMRRKSAFQGAMFSLLEGSGRLISRMRLPFYRKRVNRTVFRKLEEFLQPGDVIVTRHHDAMSNLFLPGYWPHTAFHIGTPAQRGALGVTVDNDKAKRWSGEVRVLEARKDGVLLRPLSDTLSVDAVAVVRPRLERGEIRAAIERAIVHEGKLYDFAFDFFRSDRMVCTEVVYRALDGIGEIEFKLTERAGRPTLSSEDILDAAVDGRGFDPVFVFGTPHTRRRVATGDAAKAALIKSYREQ